MHRGGRYTALIPLLQEFYADYSGQIVAFVILLTLSTLGLSVSVVMALTVFIFIYCGQALYQLFAMLGRAHEVPEALAHPTSERAGLYYMATWLMVLTAQLAAGLTG